MNPNSKPVHISRTSRTTNQSSRIVSKSMSSDNTSKFKKKEARNSQQISAQKPGEELRKSQVSQTSSLVISRSNHSVNSSNFSIKLLGQVPDREDIDVTQVFQQNLQLKIMQLSDDCRDNLKKMQRFDRFIYPIESDRILKVPIQKQVKRLEKIKNQNKIMRGKIYDNQLTITALYNHVKLVYEMNRELEQRETLRKQKDTISQKMHDMKRQSTKQIRQLKEVIRQQSQGTSPMKIPPKIPQQSKQQPKNQLSKQENTAINFISATLNGKKYSQALKQIQLFISKHGDRQQICKIFKIITKTIQEHITSEKNIKIYQSNKVEIKNLIDKISKTVRSQNYNQLTKIKNQHLRTEYKNVALMIQSFLAIVKKLEDSSEKNKKVPDDKSLEKANVKYQKLEAELKQVKNQLAKQKMMNAEQIKNKVALEKQIEKLKKFEKEIQSLKKVTKQTEEEAKSQNETIAKMIIELNKERQCKKQITKNNELLSEQIQKLKSQLQTRQKQSISNKQTAAKLLLLEKKELQIQNLKQSEKKLRASLEDSKKSDNMLIAKLKAQIAKDKNQISEALITKSQFKSLTERQNQINQQLQTQIKQNQKLTIEINQLKHHEQKIKKYEHDLEQFQKIEYQLKLKLEQSKKSEKQSTTKLNNQLKQERLKSNEANRLKSQLQKQKDANNSLQAKNEQAINQLNQLKQEILTLRQSERKINSLKTQLQSKSKQLTLVQNQYRDQKANLASEKNHSTQLQNSISKVTKLIKNQKAMKPQQISKWKKDLEESQHGKQLLQFLECYNEKKQQAKQLSQQNLIHEKQKEKTLKKASDQYEQRIRQIQAQNDKYERLPNLMKNIYGMLDKKKNDIVYRGLKAGDFVMTELRKQKNPDTISIELSNLANWIQDLYVGYWAKEEQKLNHQLCQFEQKIASLEEEAERERLSNIEKQKKLKILESQCKQTEAELEHERTDKTKIIKLKQKTLQKQSQQVAALHQQIQQKQKKFNKVMEEQKSKNTELKKGLNETQRMFRNLLNSIQRIRGNSITRNSNISQALKKQIESSDPQFMPVVKHVSEIIQFMNHSMNDEMVKQKDSFDRRIEQFQDTISLLNNKINKFTEDINNKTIENKQLDSNNRLIARQLQSLKKSSQKTINQRDTLQNRQKQKDNQIQRLKKLTQEYVQHQKKVLQKLQQQQKQIDRLSSENDKLSRFIEKQKSQKQFYSQSVKKQDEEMLKLKQAEMIYQNSYKDLERKISVFQESVTTKNKQIQQLNERSKFLQQQNLKLQQYKNQSEKSLKQYQEQISSLRKKHRDQVDALEIQKYDVEKSLEKQQNQLKYQIQERQIERNRLNNTIIKLQQMIQNLEQQKQIENKELSIKLKVLNNQKDQLRESIQRQHAKHRQNLRQKTLQLQEALDLEQRRKNDLQRELDRIKSSTNKTSNDFQIEKMQLKKQKQQLSAEIKNLQAQISQNRRLHRQQINMIRKQEYESNKQKSYREHQQVKNLQAQIDKLTEVIEVNQKNYTKIIEDNTRMFETIKQLKHQLSIMETNLKSKELQSQRNQDLNSYINSLQIKVKFFETQISKKIEEEAHRHEEIENQVEARRKQKYDHLNNFQQLEKENRNMKVDISSLTRMAEDHKKIIDQLQRNKIQNEKIIKDREIQLSEQKNAIFQLEFSLKKEQNQLFQIKNQLERSVQQKNNLNQEIEKMQDQIKQIERDKRNLEMKNIEADKENFARQLTLKKQIQILNSKNQVLARQLTNTRSQKQMFEKNQNNAVLKLQEMYRELSSIKIQNHKLDRDLQFWKEKSQRSQEKIVLGGRNQGNYSLQIQKRGEFSEFQVKQLKKTIQRLEIQLLEKQKRLESLKEQQERKNKSIQQKSQEIIQLHMKKDEISMKNRQAELQLRSLTITHKNQLEAIESAKIELIRKCKAQQDDNEKLKKKLADDTQKQRLQIKEYSKKISTLEQQLTKRQRRLQEIDSQHNLQSSNANSIQSNLVYLEKSLEQKKIQIQRAQTQKLSIMKKLQEKNQDYTRILVEMKQIQYEKTLNQQNFKQRSQNLTDKLKEQRQKYRNDKLDWQQRKYALEQNIKKLQQKLHMNQNQLVKSKLSVDNLVLKYEKQKHHYEQRNVYNTKEIEQNKANDTESTFKIKEQNKYLKQLLQMLDENYVEDSEEDYNQIQILIKISEEISLLINKNYNLQKQVKIYETENDDHWYQSFDILIESLIQFACQNHLIVNRTKLDKFSSSAFFRNTQNRQLSFQRFFTYVEKFLKNLLNATARSSQTAINLYEKTLRQLKIFTNNYEKTKNPVYIESLIRCLKGFDI